MDAVSSDGRGLVGQLGQMRALVWARLWVRAGIGSCDVSSEATGACAVTVLRNGGGVRRLKAGWLRALKAVRRSLKAGWLRALGGLGR